MLSLAWPVFVDFARPGFLAALIVLPLIVLLSRRSLAGLGSVRRPAAIAMRCLVVLVLAMALAVPEWVRTTDDQTVTFALDQSDSVPTERQNEALAFVRSAAAAMRPGKDRIAMLSFAGGTSVEQLPRPKLESAQLGDPARTHRTNLAGALRLGMALFPGDTAKRLVFLSDGNENVGVATDEADAYAALGIPIDVVSLRYEHDAEILMDQLSAPATASRDETINLEAIVRSQVATSARLILYRNDQLVDLNPGASSPGVPVRLEEGPNRFSISVSANDFGVDRFHAIVMPDDENTDAIALNNEGRAFTIVGEPARVTIVSDFASEDTETDASSAEILAEALRDGGIDCELLSVDELPDDPAALADCAALILSNVSAYALGDRRQAMLASFVRDQGGGLVAVGGDHAFSVGGYTDTLLEEILPVETKRDELRTLSLAMVIVIDRSGSMTGEKIAMARKAAIGAVRLLSRLDRIGVICFDGVFEWTVPLRLADNKSAISSRLAAIESGGGTDMYPALKQAAAALADVNTNVRHIIVLTDGQSMPGDFDGIAQSCRDVGITISAIAVGPDADRPLLSRISRLSGGRMYLAESARPLPQIFARETVLASRAGMYEKFFTPQHRPSIDEGILTGIDTQVLPPLRGHVVTDAKPMAQTSLVRVRDDGTDPILSSWQVGLGRAVAFTSGMWRKWGPEWVSWPGFSKLWTQTIRYVARVGNPAELEIEKAIKGGEARISVSAEHLPLNVQGSISLSGQIINPDFSVTSLDLQRTAAGRFEAVFPVEAPGTYLLNLPYSYGLGEERQTGILSAGVVQSYSPEYRTLEYNENTLVEIARRTGGRVLEVNNPESVFETATIQPVDVRRPFWEELLRLALVLFLMDVAVRRIAWSPAESVGRIRRWIHEVAGSRRAADSAATLDALRDVKQRGRRGADDGGTSPETREGADTSRVTHDVLDAYVADKREDAAKPAASTRPNEPESSRTEDEPASERNHTARLLRAKRRARGEEE